MYTYVIWYSIFLEYLLKCVIPLFCILTKPAAEALSLRHPFLKTRSLSNATKTSRAKAMRITDALLPYKPRPATSAALARRLVSGALGLKVNISREVREAERQKLKDAKGQSCTTFFYSSPPTIDTKSIDALITKNDELIIWFPQCCLWFHS